VDMAEACRLLPRSLTIWGNLDPVAVLSQGSPADVTRASRSFLETMANAGHSRFVLSSGCTLAVETPPENLQALMGVRDVRQKR
jgi:uroporphyrinogen decarboxylase